MSLYNFKSLIKQWEFATNEANQFFQNNQYHYAVPFYEKALFYSEIMFRHAAEADNLGIHVVSPFSVSCINIATNFKALNNKEKASGYFLYNVWQLKMLSKRECITETLYWECRHNWKKAVMQLSVFHREIKQPLSMNFWLEETYIKIQHTKAFLGVQKASLN